MAFIQNVSYTNFKEAIHKAPGPRGIAIQILNPLRDDFGFEGEGVQWPTSPFTYHETYRFNFEDSESEDSISDEDAKMIGSILVKALKEDRNVIVQCAAGISRSGAVCEVGVMLGFEDLKGHRLPNIHVKSKILKFLNLDSYEN